MVTTIQVDEKTILLLRKLKLELAVASYDEAINRIVIEHMKPQKSIAGSLAKYFKDYSTKEMIKELKEGRKKVDRF